MAGQEMLDMMNARSRKLTLTLNRSNAAKMQLKMLAQQDECVLCRLRDNPPPPSKAVGREAKTMVL
jgi:hypothetical protein